MLCTKENLYFFPRSCVYDLFVDFHFSILFLMVATKNTTWFFAQAMSVLDATILAFQITFSFVTEYCKCHFSSYDKFSPFSASCTLVLELDASSFCFKISHLFYFFPRILTVSFDTKIPDLFRISCTVIFPVDVIVRTIIFPVYS